MSVKKKVKSDIDKLKLLMSYWISHNNEHIRDNERWFNKVEEAGLKEVADELEKVIKLSKEANKHIEIASKKLEKGHKPKPGKILKAEKPQLKLEKQSSKDKLESFEFKQIGIIKTPYTDNAPYQPVHEDEGEFCIIVNPEYASGLRKLIEFRYIYVIYYIHQIKQEVSMIVAPSWTGGAEVGVFASRSPVRPNFIGLSIVRIKRIVSNKIFTSGLDVFDKTPLLDIKPYVKDLDSKPDANYGWIEEIDDYKHLLLHIKGIPHSY
jgi:tRNA-Thr(GGU) m(6)t(6)A37 methyltransferase TsaA